MQADLGIVSLFRYDCFLSNLFQFIVHLSSYRPVLWSLDIKSIAKEPTNIYVYIFASRPSPPQKPPNLDYPLHFYLNSPCTFPCSSHISFFRLFLLSLQLTQSFQSHYGPGFDSASNRNVYQKSSWG
jgi:hypothetical protein